MHIQTRKKKLLQININIKSNIIKKVWGQ